jgi:hypothetical protein
MPDVPEKQIKRLKILIQEAETSVAAAKELLTSLVGEEAPESAKLQEEPVGKVVEGVFDGQNMVGSDGKTYPVPANYASKSKLVQGDILKLTIAEDVLLASVTYFKAKPGDQVSVDVPEDDSAEWAALEAAL